MQHTDDIYRALCEPSPDATGDACLLVNILNVDLEKKPEVIRRRAAEVLEAQIPDEMENRFGDASAKPTDFQAEAKPGAIPIITAIYLYFTKK